MAECIQANLQTPTQMPGEIAAADQPSPPKPAPPEINAFALLLHLISVRFQRLFGRKSA
jgi:hypothetical protein